MSQCYWGIQGYAIEYDEDWFKYDFDDMSCDELFEHIAKENHVTDWDKFSPINWTSDGDCKYWIIYTPNAHFMMHYTEKGFTCKDDIAIAMYKLLKPYLKDTVTEETFMTGLEWVSTYGCN